MKKIYKNPVLEVIKISNQQQLLAGSTIPTGGTPTDPASSDAPYLEGDDW